ncbi:hypothetical protein CUP1364 [Campylobacter upsaliensis RM3195]|nr:hypothetical protein CUP1364 [Campylobacter upsaliensis RM3195]
MYHLEKFHKRTLQNDTKIHRFGRRATKQNRAKSLR